MPANVPGVRQMANTPVIERFFVCVGAQKSGTTWLARVLGEHPDVFVTPVKEIHYFDHLAGITSHLSERKRRSRFRKYHQRMLTQWGRWRELRAQRDWYDAYMADPIDDDWYASLFRERGGRPIAGEATPEYALIGEEGFRHLCRLAPEARVLYILRNPVTRAWSQILHLCRSSGRRAEQMSADELLALTREGNFDAISDYSATLEAIAAVFPEAQLWTGFYEEIHADRGAAVAAICEFIGARPEALRSPPLEQRHNVSQQVEMAEAVREELRDRFRRQVDAVEAHVGRVPHSWREG